MENIPYRTAAFLTFSGSILLLVLSCGKPYVDRYDPTYRGDYQLSLSVEDSSEFFAFIPVNVPYSHKGDDRYVSFSVFTEPEGFVDTLHFRASDPDFFSLYFTAPFSGNVVFRARRHNGRTDTLSFPVAVRSPFEIAGNRFLVQGDTNEFTVTMAEGAEKAAEAVRKVSWFLDTSLVMKNASLSDTFSLICEKSELSRKLKLLCTDFRGNRFTTEPFTPGIPVPGPAILDVKAPVFTQPHTSLEFVAQVKSAPKDSGWVRLIIGTDTLEKRVGFETDSVVKVTLFHSEGIPDTGRHSLSFEYESSVHHKCSQPLEVYVPVTDYAYRLQLLCSEPVAEMGDSLKLKATALRTNGESAGSGEFSWTVLLENDILYSNKQGDSSIAVLPERAGELQIHVQFISESGMISEKLIEKREVVDFSSMRPDAILATVSPAFTSVPVTFILPVPQTEDNFEETVWNAFRKEDTVFTKTTPGVRTTVRFETPGEYSIHGKHAGSSYSCSLTVLDGSPSVDSVIFPQRVFVHKEEGVFTFHCSATGDIEIDLYNITLIKDNDTLTSSSPVPRMSVPFKTSQEGEWRVETRVRNRNGLWSETYTPQRKLTIDLGLPRVTAFDPDTISLQKDSVFKVSVRDLDGLVDEIVIDWGDETKDTLQAHASFFTGQITHSYPQNVPSEGFYDITVSATNESGQKSPPYSKKIYVLDGVPQVNISGRSFVYKGSTYRTVVRGDTLFSPRIHESYSWSGYAGGSTITIKEAVTLNTSDRDGEVLKYAADYKDTPLEEITWSTSADVWLDSSNGYYNWGFHPDSSAVKVDLYCSDNDGKIGKDSCYLRSVDKPDIMRISPIDTVRTDAVTIQFSGADIRDYDSADVTIWLGYRDPFSKTHTIQIPTTFPLPEYNEETGHKELALSIPSQVYNGAVTLKMQVKNSVWMTTEDSTGFILYR